MNRKKGKVEEQKMKERSVEKVEEENMAKEYGEMESGEK